MGIHSSLPSSTSYDKNGNAIMKSSTPDEVVESFIAVLAKCKLQKPFDKNTKLLLTRWMPHINQDISLPAITWKVIHTSLNNQTPQNEKYRQTLYGSELPVKIYQQNFDHIVQFECYAETQEEVSALEWWLVKQTYMYRYIMARAGAQNWRYLEGREDFLMKIGKDNYPARPIRYAFTTGITFPVVSNILTRVDTETFISNVPIVVEETITRGNDCLLATNVVLIYEVTSIDGTIQYYPSYDALTKKFVWSPDQEQPVDGADYLVSYIQYGSDSLDQQVSAE